jgi:cell division septal protein FtsQ
MAFFSKKQSDVPRRRLDAPSSNEQRPSSSELSQRYAFKRSRTLTGSSSSQISSSGELNAQIQSPRAQAHHLTRRRRHVGLLLFLTILGSIVLYGLISQFTAKALVVTNDASIVLDNTYEKAIQRYFDEQPAERLRFLLNINHLRDFMQTATPEIKNISVVGASGLGVSKFQVEMRTPIAGWSINGEQHYVDDSGTPFNRNYFAKPSVEIVDNSGIQVSAGQAVASNSFLSFVGQVVGLSKQQGYIATQVVIPAATTRQIELHLKDIPYPIKFVVDRPAGEQVEDMVQAVGWMKRHNLNPQYVDVRVSGKAFYK